MLCSVGVSLFFIYLIDFYFYYIFYYAKKSGKKIGFPMPTAKNGFHILVLHLKNHIGLIEEKTVFLCTFTGPLPKFYERRDYESVNRKKEFGPKRVKKTKFHCFQL